MKYFQKFSTECPLKHVQKQLKVRIAIPNSSAARSCYLIRKTISSMPSAADMTYLHVYFLYKKIFERMALSQRNFRFFSGLLSTSNEFLA